LVWRDAAGSWTAALAGDFETAAANAATEGEALRQLKELLEWRMDREPWNVDPDLKDPALVEVKVEVRPEYSVAKKVIPCPDTVWLRVPCVTGKQESGLHLCVAPHLELQFNFQDPAELKSLVVHYVKERLQGCTPAQLAARLPPRDCRLAEVVARNTSGQVKHVAPADRSELRVLFQVADPLLHDGGRKRPVTAAYGREDLVRILSEKLSREKANVLLVGEPGVGKSTVLRDAAKAIARAHKAQADETEAEASETAKADPELRSYRFWRSSGGRMIAGMRYLGEWEERCEQFIAQLANIGGIFCAENLLELAQVGGQEAGDSVAAFLLPYLQRGELRMVAEATPAEVDACRRLLPGLQDVFQVLQVPVFDDTTAVRVLENVAAAHATARRLEIEPGAITLVHRLFKRFQPYAAFPGPAANFVMKLCEGKPKKGLHGLQKLHESNELHELQRLHELHGEKRSNEKQLKTGTVGREGVIGANEVIELFSGQTVLPEVFLRDEILLRSDQVTEYFAARIIGQPQATTHAARLIAAIKTGLTDPQRPLGVLLFCGPTGVGKTALAKTFVEYCFGASGTKERLARLDMSEYSAYGAARRFTENPRGGPARWIEQVRRQPFCVVLFDEIEKAAPEVFDVLLSLLDEGRLTDRFGRVTWFRSAVVIMTSNLGANALGSAGFRTEAPPSYETEAARFFRPEFFNRLDGVIEFKPLELNDVEAITRKELSELAAREGLAAGQIQIHWTDRLVTALAQQGYDHRFGARPLQRVIENAVVAPLARWRVANPKAHGVVLTMDLDAAGGVMIRTAAGKP
jgi:ATP-dependent Clp protease ATP-binding subunit ClpC